MSEKRWKCCQLKKPSVTPCDIAVGYYSYAASRGLTKYKQGQKNEKNP
jgi:hypothetical protein